MNLSMYSGFSDIVKKDGIKKAAETARKLGFDSVEFLDVQSSPPLIADEATAKEYRRILEDNGLTVACFSFGINVFDPENPDYDSDTAVKQLIHSAKMAAILGSPYFHHTLVFGLRKKENHVSDIDFVINGLLPHTCKVADVCDSLGVTTLYEPQGMYINGASNFPAFYRAMKGLGKNVGVCGDTGNPLFCDWRPEDFYRDMISEIKHVHIKDYRIYTDNAPDGVKSYTSIGGTRIGPVLLGKGDINIPYCLDLLKNSGYKGAISLEGEYSPIDDITFDIEYMNAYR